MPGGVPNVMAYGTTGILWIMKSLLVYERTLCAMCPRAKLNKFHLFTKHDIVFHNLSHHVYIL